MQGIFLRFRCIYTLFQVHQFQVSLFLRAHPEEAVLRASVQHHNVGDLCGGGGAPAVHAGHQGRQVHHLVSDLTHHDRHIHIHWHPR